VSQSKYLSAFLTSAMALGGLYILDRFFSTKDRVNPARRYQDTRDFTETEKLDISRKYVQGQASTSLAEEYSTYVENIQRILQETGTPLRDKKEALRLGKLIQIPEHIQIKIKEMYQTEDENGKKPMIKTLVAAFPGYSPEVITRFLVEEKLYEKPRTQELSADDVEKLLAAKRAANASNAPLSLNNIGQTLNLIHSNVAPQVVLRLFAAHGLNRPFDYVGRLTADERNAVMRYFPNRIQTASIREISEATGIPEGSISNYISYHNLVPTPTSEYHVKDLTQDEVNLIIDYYENGYNTQQIIKQTGIYRKRVNDVINQHRALKGEHTSRLSDVQLRKHHLLITRHPDIIQYIVTSRQQIPALSYYSIADNLMTEMRKRVGFEDFMISAETVRSVYEDYLASQA